MSHRGCRNNGNMHLCILRVAQVKDVDYLILSLIFTLDLPHLFVIIIVYI